MAAILSRPQCVKRQSCIYTAPEFGHHGALPVYILWVLGQHSQCWMKVEHIFLQTSPTSNDSMTGLGNNDDLMGHWLKFSIATDNGLVPNRRQPITWINVDPVHWCIYAALGEWGWGMGGRGGGGGGVGGGRLGVGEIMLTCYLALNEICSYIFWFTSNSYNVEKINKNMTEYFAKGYLFHMICWTVWLPGNSQQCEYNAWPDDAVKRYSLDENLVQMIVCLLLGRLSTLIRRLVTPRRQTLVIFGTELEKSLQRKFIWKCSLQMADILLSL